MGPMFITLAFTVQRWMYEIINTFTLCDKFIYIDIYVFHLQAHVRESVALKFTAESNLVVFSIFEYNVLSD
jgi:hypothetical protein